MGRKWQVTSGATILEKPTTLQLRINISPYDVLIEKASNANTMCHTPQVLPQILQCILLISTILCAQQTYTQDLPPTLCISFDS